MSAVYCRRQGAFALFSCNLATVCIGALLFHMGSARPLFYIRLIANVHAARVNAA